MISDIYGLIKAFLVGDLIWSLPALLAGIVAFLPTLLFRTRRRRLLVFGMLFLSLWILFHLIADPWIHNFQAWYSTPLGPSMILE